MPFTQIKQDIYQNMEEVDIIEDSQSDTNQVEILAFS